LLEPVIAEGGVLTANDDFVATINQLRQETGCLVIADEIQTGFGRCGSWLASERIGLDTDIVTMAKALGGGLPLGMTLVCEKVWQTLHAGDHGTTFGGNPVACAAGFAVACVMEKERILENVNARAEQLRAGLAPFGTVRGMGLLIGVETGKPVGALIDACREQRLLVLRAGENVLRMLPPLNLSEAEADEGLERFKRAFKTVP
jgi:acetylornithine/succinyldiaminopimelate/putrescine aminotransferase